MISLFELSYKEFFLNKLKKFGVKSPVQMSKSLKSSFFSEIKREWSKIKPKKKK